MLNQDYRVIDQSTPDRDEELFSDISLEKSFFEATGEAFDAAVLENLNRFSSAMPILQDIGLAPKTPSSWGPNLPSGELNKKYKTDIFKDDMTDFQAQILMKIREEKARSADFSNEYKGASFLGQTAPQWFGGFGGEAVSNPINLLPFGQLTRFGAVGQGMVTNAVGAVADWSFRKSMESRTGDQVGAADLITDLVVGTAIGTGIDIGINKLNKRPALFREVTPEDAMGYKRIDELKEKVPSQDYKTWVDEQHTRLLKERASAIDNVVSEHVKAGIPVNPDTILRAIDPIPQKLAILEVIDPVVEEDTRGMGTQFHGTSTEITGGLTDDSYTSLNIYGQGFYTTDAKDIAKGYTKKGKGKSPVIYKVREKDSIKLFDMEKQLGKDDLDIFKWVDSELLPDDLTEFNLRQLYDFIRDESIDLSYSADVIQEVFETIGDSLRRKGYGGFTHIGGIKTNKAAHKVNIYWDPKNQLTLEKVIKEQPRTRKILAPKDAEGVDYISSYPEGVGARQVDENAIFKVDGDEYSSLELANDAAKKTGSDVIIENTDGTVETFKPIDVDAILKDMRETTRVNVFTLPEGYFIEVDGLPFDDIGKASAFAKASNTKVTILDKDGASTKIDPVLEAMPRDYDAPKKATIELDGKKIEVDRAAVEELEAKAKNPDARVLIDEESVKAFQEFDENAATTNKMTELEQDVNFLTDVIKAEIGAAGDKAPADMIKHVEEIEAIDKTAEVEDNVFKAITNCILRSL